MAETDVTRRLAEMAAGLRYEDIDDDARAVARQCLLDWFGVTLAGASENCTAIVAGDAEDQGGHPQATLVGRGVRMASRQAALVNGTASHAHDYDDVNMTLSGHATVAVAGGLLALAERLDSTGQDLLVAFVAGYETACRVGALVNPSHYAMGFHATATAGTFGAAAACGRLLELDTDRMARAFGIAGTMAAGLKSQFGTDCKPFHAGRATEAGLMAATMAQRGFTSRGDILDCAQGFAETHGTDFRADAATGDAPGGGFHVRNNLFKYHAACYLTHAAIECGMKLRTEHGLKPDDIASVKLRVERGADRVCNIPEPATGLETKFSLRMTAAFALAGIDTSGMTNYVAANATDPALTALRDRIEVDLVEGQPQTWSELTVTTTDGRTLTAEHDSGIPAGDVAGQGERIAHKFRMLAEPVIGDNRAGALREAVLALESQPSAAQLMQLSA
ncbi:MAG: MmgE/PrpD family protein [Minwuia sp.]|uniref:MmgE/PrpD family protein n=1 Tax=Minwuia sp. TaxID=2493630 RepID=UPI003A89E982